MIQLIIEVSLFAISEIPLKLWEAQWFHLSQLSAVQFICLSLE